MKRLKYIVPVFILLNFTTSCEDSLDIEPIQEVSPEVALGSGENVENILIGTYAEAGEAQSYGGRLQMLTDLYGFDDEASWIGTFQQPRQVFNKQIFVDNSYVRDIWLNGYEIINQANLVIDNISLVDEDNQDNTIGQAYFLRAMAYFDLVRLFGANYQPGQENTQLGVPITLEGIVDYSGDLNIPRNTVEEVYNQVLSDLDQAVQLMPSSNDIFADSYSAQALLARVYLQQGRYAEARDAANEVINNSGHELTETYAGAFNNDSDSDEDIFSFQVTTQDGANDLIVHYADQTNGGRGGDIILNPEFTAMFDSESDVRASYVYESAQNEEVLTGKYTNQFGNIPFIRLAEMYLIRAEGNFRETTSTGATPLEDINTVRDRAEADLLGEVSLDDILLERELELAFEGHLIHDLKRTGRAVGDFDADADALVFPVPQREMDANNLLEQNPGYGS